MDFDENLHEGSELDGESESVLILKNSFCRVGQKSIFFRFLRPKCPELWHFFTDFVKIDMKAQL